MAMSHSIDTREISRCTCRRVRRTARQLTRIYDHALAPAGLTANQFDVLANLFGATLSDRGHLSIGALAERLGMHPTTLNRDLKPLLSQGLIADAQDPADRRVRGVTLTRKGRAKLRAAVPFWRRAQAHIEKAIGASSTGRLNSLLDATAGKLERVALPL